MKKTRSSALLFFLGISLLMGCTTSVKKPLFLKNEKAEQWVVVIHGFGRQGESMNEISEALYQQGYQICQLDYSSVGKTVEEVKKEAFSQIDQCVDNAAKVNFVGHSLGGLLIRAYLAQDPSLINEGKLEQVVMLGTPNNGSEVSDHYDNDIWSRLLGGMYDALGTKTTDFAQTLPEPQFRAGIIAGKESFTITKGVFDKTNDGLVSVDSTKLANMKDFILMDVNHATMKRDKKVIEQIVFYLKNASFDKGL